MPSFTQIRRSVGGAAKDVYDVTRDIVEVNVNPLKLDEMRDKYLPGQEPPSVGQGPQGAGAVNAKAFGNVAFSSESLYKEGAIPGSIDTMQYKK